MTGLLEPLLRRCGIPDGAVAPWRDDLILPHTRAAGRLPRDARSVLVCVFPYYVGDMPRNLSLYAMLPDYHQVVSGMLEDLCARLSERWADNVFVPFSDVSPVNEVEAGVRASLGLRGKNGLLLHRTWGSLCFLGEVVTDLELPAQETPRGCAGCGACLRACPTGALSEKGFDAEKCLSHISQKKGLLTPREEELLRGGGLAWGCDRCQLACPVNREVPRTPIGAFSRDVEPVLTKENLPRLFRSRAFSWRGRAVLERNLALLQTNQEGVVSHEI